MNQVISFAEESCWDGEKFRSIRREVVFTVVGHAIRRGKVVRGEFTADYGVFYDEDDSWLINILDRELPGIEWGALVYWKLPDHSGIRILSGETGDQIGSIFPRGRTKQKLSGENLAANVVPIGQAGEYRARREDRDRRGEKKRLARRRDEDSGPDAPAA